MKIYFFHIQIFKLPWTALCKHYLYLIGWEAICRLKVHWVIQSHVAMSLYSGHVEVASLRKIYILQTVNVDFCHKWVHMYLMSVYIACGKTVNKILTYCINISWLWINIAQHCVNRHMSTWPTFLQYDSCVHPTGLYCWPQRPGSAFDIVVLTNIVNLRLHWWATCGFLSYVGKRGLSPF